MDERVLNWLKVNVGETFESPRSKVSKRKKYDLRVVSVGSNRVNIDFVRSKYHAMPLYFWMFDRTLKYLQENEGRAVRLGAKLIPPYESDTVEGQIWRKPCLTGNTSYKAAPHVCDILALASLVEYVLASNPETCRKVQAVKLLSIR
jgi:hypothetical protein